VSLVVQAFGFHETTGRLTLAGNRDRVRIRVF
jgi:hypothetical protein